MPSYFVSTKFSCQFNTAENISYSNKQDSGIVLTASVLMCVVVLNCFSKQMKFLNTTLCTEAWREKSRAEWFTFLM